MRKMVPIVHHLDPNIPTYLILNVYTYQFIYSYMIMHNLFFVFKVTYVMLIVPGKPH